MQTTALIAGIRTISKLLATLLGFALLPLFIAGCGGETLQSIEVNPTSADLTGIGATQQFQVVATYSSGRQADVTLQSTYSIATPNPPGPATPPNAIAINATGQAQAVLGACTWTSVQAGNPPTTQFATQPYVMTVSFGGRSGTTYLSIASLAGCTHP